MKKLLSITTAVVLTLTSVAVAQPLSAQPAPTPANQQLASATLYSAPLSTTAHLSDTRPVSQKEQQVTADSSADEAQDTTTEKPGESSQPTPQWRIFTDSVKHFFDTVFLALAAFFGAVDWWTPLFGSSD
ncbi:hypothetical protein N7326_06480 [Corynebacterium sp. ES2794-CONJ1]|uniref:hypothetical protein n=1 Tax=unclassified Corynebacterium TaxID=2624378 RepID=UPI002168B5DD|nr:MULTISPECIES: hypothetical protein [unclassified Corynebacterium]MCS4490178.1 hypothetical protein [Corynebacterium sp. ES2775-CONJ]MCS4492011.1 hypothetical protein [Corynebacterium sp. ES2715-CONJ3]MCS4532115.1 hypothetical protein [Corynebacterium sp. ES2730-CONJ]MCU9519517.1 hypothetical protein [Corynebacterium sp. ES2794-CONJ1]